MRATDKTEGRETCFGWLRESRCEISARRERADRRVRLVESGVRRKGEIVSAARVNLESDCSSADFGVEVVAVARQVIKAKNGLTDYARNRAASVLPDGREVGRVIDGADFARCGHPFSESCCIADVALRRGIERCLAGKSLRAGIARVAFFQESASSELIGQFLPIRGQLLQRRSHLIAKHIGANEHIIADGRVRSGISRIVTKSH
ncbi:hypothetical protein SH584_11535 [Sphingomonas sp. LY29]|uniref:hypothetical protein n=1 Tax=Sphingomonas sp. LY29 TaxID=3095341 RepID=UPI002D793531|nr:hypothetical protein [Sphingomonas sp. LY29]WRP25663.1 hypothetical protein SH584_11535 [Sphingomonas sp. LY29]